MTTDITEKGLESLIVSAMTGQLCVSANETNVARLQHTDHDGTGWICGNPQDYDRGYAVDLFQISAFIKATQPGRVSKLDLNRESPVRHKFSGSTAR